MRETEKKHARAHARNTRRPPAEAKKVASRQPPPPSLAFGSLRLPNVSAGPTPMASTPSAPAPDVEAMGVGGSGASLRGPTCAVLLSLRYGVTAGRRSLRALHRPATRAGSQKVHIPLIDRSHAATLKSPKKATGTALTGPHTSYTTDTAVSQASARGPPRLSRRPVRRSEAVSEASPRRTSDVTAHRRASLDQKLPNFSGPLSH
jgi:hypothetical protein